MRIFVRIFYYCRILTETFDVPAGCSGRKKELSTNQSVFCRSPTLFIKSANLGKKGFNWPVWDFGILILQNNPNDAQKNCFSTQCWGSAPEPCDHIGRRNLWTNEANSGTSNDTCTIYGMLPWSRFLSSESI